MEFLSLSCRSYSSWNVSKQWQGARKKYGCFHRLHRAKLQSNTWGMPGGRLEVLELTDIFTPLLNNPPHSLIWVKPSFSGTEVMCIKLCTLLSFLSPLYFVIDHLTVVTHNWIQSGFKLGTLRSNNATAIRMSKLLFFANSLDCFMYVMKMLILHFIEATTKFYFSFWTCILWSLGIQI